MSQTYVPPRPFTRFVDLDDGRDLVPSLVTLEDGVVLARRDLIMIDGKPFVVVKPGKPERDQAGRSVVTAVVTPRDRWRGKAGARPKYEWTL